jgi:tRNA-specific 2-thiouridylase
LGVIANEVKQSPIKNTVAVAMSGGVDSSVTAALLSGQGYRVVGLTMKLFDQNSALLPESHRGCCSLDAIYRAQAVCKTLGIPHYSLDFTAEFERCVIQDFTAEYLAGRTPNPCIRCNTYLKWGLLYQKARSLGCDFLATGHYARIVRDDGENCLLRAVDSAKDQSYALWGIPRDLLETTLLPLGELTKSEVRKIATEFGLKSAQTPDSQEICFIPDGHYADFLRSRDPDAISEIGPGELIQMNDGESKAVGEHDGYPFYTVGQRKGLGGGFSEPRYVLRVEPQTNRVYIGPKEMLLERSFEVDQVNWLIPTPIQPFQAQIQIRYRSPTVEGTVIPREIGCRVELQQPAEAIAPGQSAAFYNGEKVIGGGRILEIIH